MAPKRNIIGGVDPKALSLPKYIPFCINVNIDSNDKGDKGDKGDKNKTIFDTKEEIILNTNIDYPRCSLGFNHFIHAIKRDTEILKQFENKKKVYLVINPFERYIDGYNKSIGDISKTYFDLGKNKTPDILSRGFYKLWEIFFMFDIIDVTKEKFTSAHLAEGPGSFIQATIFFRDMFCKKGLSKNDKYYAITLHPEDTKGHVPELEKNFINYYMDEKPRRFFQHETVNKAQSEQSGGTRDNGDLMSPETLQNFYGGANSTVKEKVDLITADGGFEWVNENIQEQEYFKLLFSQIVFALNMQKKNGTFVVKFFETFTTTSFKFISILNALYDKVFMVKPLTSRPSNSEKYAVCIGFKYSESDAKLKNILKTMNDMHTQIYKNKNLNIVDIFPEYDISKSFLNRMRLMNTEILNSQFKAIGDIITFINSQNYYGDTYQEKREEQIQAAEYWTKLFFMDLGEFKENKKKINDISFSSNKINIDKSIEFEKTLVV
jgi:23S rRNA U2552 (ribose-2'-O)-methylase RlmE/FtsJ